MADRTALSMIGLMMVAATLCVMTAGAVVVSEHLTGKLHFDGEAPITVSMPGTMATR